MNILYVDQSYRLNEAYMYPYYGALFRELSQLENVYLIEGLIPNINNLLKSSKISFDCIVFQCIVQVQANYLLMKQPI